MVEIGTSSGLVSARHVEKTLTKMKVPFDIVYRLLTLLLGL